MRDLENNTPRKMSGFRPGGPFGNYHPVSHCVESHSYGVVMLSPDREIALVKGRLSKKWSLPKGHGGTHERPLLAAVREAKEKTGVDLSRRKWDERINFPSGTYWVYLLEEKPDLRPEDNNEICETAWIPYGRIGALHSTNQDLRNIISRVNLGRVHDRIVDRKIPRLAFQSEEEPMVIHASPGLTAVASGDEVMPLNEVILGVEK
jgi:8-oxo-dGTP pyrophosphatase MutT (NUDIX family)